MPYAIPHVANLAITSAVLLFHALVFVFLPLYLLPQSLWWGLALVPLFWLNSTHWGLIHEAIHKILYPDPRINEYTGRGLSILMGTSFAVLRFGHLMHHKLNRDWHSEITPNSTRGAKLYYYANLFFGLYLSEVLTSLMLALLPRRIFLKVARATFLKDYPEVAVSGERFFYEKNHVHGLRIDMALATLIFGAAFYIYGTYWPVLAGFIALRALTISFMDNIYHYATPADNTKAGKELILAKPLSVALLHGNYHETHHLNPLVPWRHLPNVHREQARGFDGAFLKHGVMQFGGPVKLHETYEMKPASI